MKRIDVGQGTFVEYYHLTLYSWDGVFDDLAALNWVRHGTTPRDEYYVNKKNVPYTYGTPPHARTYHPQPCTDLLKDLFTLAETIANCKFEVCFLNYYRDGKDQLGWHSDDSPEMDDARPIAILTFGAAREIWFRPRPELAPSKDPVKLLLEHGSICIMPAGMQDSHQHRIPKSGEMNCGPRISLTFRGLAQ